MCEKPLSMTIEEAVELEKLARRRKRVLGIPFTYSGFPMVKLARDLVASGELGKIDKVVLEYSQGSFRKIDFSKPLDKRNSWKMDPKRSGRSCVVADIGVHGFHLIEYVTGLQVKKLLADLSSFAPGNKLDDDASILMRLGGGAKVSMVVSKVATGEENGVRLRVYGDKASLYWNQEENCYLKVKYPFDAEKTYKRNASYMKKVSEASVRSSRIPAGHHEGFIEAFANIYDEFCAAVCDRKAHDFPGPREGVRTMRFVEASLKSAANGNVWVNV
jgi:predicted dehydrogenase